MATKQKGKRTLIAGVVIITSSRDKGGGTRKYNRNRAKCARYRSRVGKPNGRGVDGNKSGKNS